MYRLSLRPATGLACTMMGADGHWYSVACGSAPNFLACQSDQDVDTWTVSSAGYVSCCFTCSAVLRLPNSQRALFCVSCVQIFLLLVGDMTLWWLHPSPGDRALPATSTASPSMASRMTASSPLPPLSSSPLEFFWLTALPPPLPSSMVTTPAPLNLLSLSLSLSLSLVTAAVCWSL